MATKNLSEYNVEKVPDASNMIFGIVVSEWNSEITGAMLEGCVNTLEKHGALPEHPRQDSTWFFRTDLRCPPDDP